MPIDPDDAGERAAARLRRAQEMTRQRESAREDYDAQARATRDNMARMKALRLAREATEQQTATRETAARRKARSP